MWACDWCGKDLDPERKWYIVGFQSTPYYKHYMGHYKCMIALRDFLTQEYDQYKGFYKWEAVEKGLWTHEENCH